MANSNKRIIYLSPAKLNLGLKIEGKYYDPTRKIYGYHNLHTTFCLIDLFDEIEIWLNNTNNISIIDHQQAWFYQKDLAYKAAALLREYTNTQYGVNIKIKKVIPSGSGLGGGSSNAATVLLALNDLWQLNLDNITLLNLASKLGADVAFFVYGRNAIATGIGDVFVETDIPEYYFVIVVPDFHLSTKAVFDTYDKINASINYFDNINIPNSSNVNNVTTNTNNAHTSNNSRYYNEEMLNNISLIKEQSQQIKVQFTNDLQVSAMVLQKKLLDIFNELKSYGNPSLTGSGSAVFLTYNDKQIAKKVAKDLSLRYNTYLTSRLLNSPLFNNSSLK